MQEVANNTWKIETRDNGESIVLTFSKRAGNELQEIQLSHDEFGFLYQAVSAFVQLES